MLNPKQTCEMIIKDTGIILDGNNPWDIRVSDSRFYSEVLSGGSLALGESYMDGWWDCDRIDEFINRILSKKLENKFSKKSFILPIIKAKFLNLQNKNRAFDIGKKHYDTGNDLFKNMLDKRLVYTCAFWKNTKNLDKAQENKLELSCKKLKLKPGMNILDIGCGFGSFLKYACEKYKIKGIGITVSKEQAELTRELCKGLPIEIKLMDYRDLPKLNQKFDRIASLGMFEHVGKKNYKTYMNIANKCLKPDGLFLLHTIGTLNKRGGTDPWLNKYIFPAGELPSMIQILNSSNKYFRMEDFDNHRQDYEKTLLAWNNNFQKNYKNIEKNYNQRFKRMWEYYLLLCAGAFRSGNIQLWQIIFSKKYSNLGYECVR